MTYTRRTQTVVKTLMKISKREGDQRRTWAQREKHVSFFYKLNTKENVDVTSIPHKEEYDEQNYESVEECKTVNNIHIPCIFCGKIL